MSLRSSRFMILSREAKKKQAVHNEQIELVTCNIILKFLNALDKPPLMLSHGYQGLSMF